MISPMRCSSHSALFNVAHLHSCQLPKMKNRERPHPQPALILSFLWRRRCSHFSYDLIIFGPDTPLLLLGFLVRVLVRVTPPIYRLAYSVSAVVIFGIFPAFLSMLLCERARRMYYSDGPQVELWSKHLPVPCKRKVFYQCRYVGLGNNPGRCYCKCVNRAGAGKC